ncbi:MAG: hypothetical protein KatS3mg103_0419 [Phycisphaerales bacterium]|nr:MAG: hypothetical protein KatS3mg103_0419 [Phycisphaerales bacterium]
MLAIDAHPMALELTANHPRIGAAERRRLTLRRASMEGLRLPACDLLNASFSLPFCRPEAFDRLWEAIHRAIRPGGVLACQLFGDADSWAALPDRTHHSRRQVGALLRGRYRVVHLREERADGHDAEGYAKHWHVFHLVARRCPTRPQAGPCRPDATGSPWPPTSPPGTPGRRGPGDRQEHRR